jgi:intein/homing endonuclease
MADGTEKSIENIKLGDEIIGYSGFKQTFATVTAYQERINDLYKIKFKSGREIIASKDHRFMQIDGYKPMPEYSGTMRELKYKPTSDVSPDEAALITYFITEGCMTSSNMSFTAANPCVQEDFERIIKTRSWGYRLLKKENIPGRTSCFEYRLHGGESKYSHRNTPRVWARKHGIYNKYSFQKTIPDIIMAANLKVISKVIEVLYATDGTLGVYDGSPQICYTSANRRLCDQIKNLLSRFGIFSSIYYIKNKCRGAYTLKIDGLDGMLKFVDRFNVIGKKDACDKIRVCIRSKDKIHFKADHNLLPCGVKKLIQEKGLRKRGIRVDNKYRISRAKARLIPSIKKFADSDVNWDYVESIEYHGRERSCDIETTSKNYIANGIITHNSTIFTQWGAIWLYLQDNNNRILIASQNEIIANRFMWFIQKQVLTNPVLRKIYPELGAVNKLWTRTNRWSQTYIELPRTTPYKEASVTSIGVGGAAQSGHYDYVFIDDPVGAKHQESDAELQKVMGWHDNVDELLDNPNFHMSEASTVQLICTFWFPGDYGCYVRENYPEYKWMVVPCLKDSTLKNEENFIWLQDKDAEEGTSNWEGAPKGKSKTEYYLNMKANPEKQHIFWSQHMNNPGRGDSAFTKFDASWFLYYRRNEAEDILICNDDNEEFKLKDIPLYGMIDPGGFSETKLTKGGSRNALLIGGQPLGTYKKFIVYTHADRFKHPSKFMDKLFEAHAKYRPRQWFIDTAGQQLYIFKDIKEEGKKRGMRIPIAKLEPDVRKDSKDVDIQGLIAPVSNGEIYMHKSMVELRGEITSYPQGMTKDLIDMLGKLNRKKWVRGQRPDNTDYIKYNYVGVNFDRGQTGYGI